MKTIVTRDPSAAAEIIKSGGLAAVPTETVYGLAADGLNSAAVEKIYEVKGRPAAKPLSLMVPDPESAARCCREMPGQALALAEKFWPGPLTIVLNASETVPGIVRAGGETVGLRCPDHALTLELLRTCGLPLAAPSANPSGAESPKSAEDVLRYFDGKIDCVLDGGKCGIGRESTIVSLAAEPYAVLRRGALPEEDISDALVSAMKIIGITGGTGAGKTTALSVIRKMGALVIDCDELYHGLADKSGSLRAELTERFGEVYADGKLDRGVLRGIVFSDPEALSDLNRITHRHIDKEVLRLLRMHAMSGGTLAAVDAALLPGSPTAKRCCKIYAVTAPASERERRIMIRDGISAEEAKSRIGAQKSDEYYLNNCDEVLYNTGDEEKFAAECEAAFRKDVENGKKD